MTDHAHPTCCAPLRTTVRPDDTSRGPRARRHSSHDAGSLNEMRDPGEVARGVPGSDRIELPGGTFSMGSTDVNALRDGEGPVRSVRLSPFGIDRYAVSNARFAAFVQATGHVTDAERFGWSFVFHAFVPCGAPAGGFAQGAPWWRQVFGASWHRPEGPGSDVRDRWDHPVVHVSWNDATAFAAWAGGHLPTEAQWEYAARGGRERTTFPWGDALTEGGVHHCNVWQGDFPFRDDADDGWAGTAPVGAFEPNGYGLHQAVGNVWEWCADRFTIHHPSGPLDDPAGPDEGPGRVMKGGSYLCHDSYCNRYRVAARTVGVEDDALGHVGFRVAYAT